MPLITSDATETRRRSTAIALNRIAYAISQHWFIGFILLTSVWVGLPWLAPVFARLGWDKLANTIYSVYSYQCHQLPQRSFFLFGQRMMYPLDRIQSVYKHTFDPVLLRGFIGNAALGYKVAWSDRMVSAYTSIPLAALVWRKLRKRLRPISLLELLLLALPMIIDGGTHMISDVAGIGQGFRDTNEWLAALTNHSLPNTFYVGDALGSFNSWMRLITGILFGAGMVWFAFPYIQQGFEDISKSIEEKFSRVGVEL